jgi:DNA-binding NarL/FixJ family response regulator
LRKLRQLHPLLPAVAVVPEDAIPRLLEEFATDPVVLLRDTARPEHVAAAMRALIGAPARARADVAPDWPPALEPRSYAHLAGLLPRSLERTIEFDVGASVIVGPDREPVVDVHAKGDLDHEMLQDLRESVLALFRIVAGGALDPRGAAATFPPSLRSSLYIPLATESRVVGLTYLGAFRDDAFSAEDQRVLAALATHASAAYRRVESSVTRLRLTPRQSQVLALIASGLPDKDVAKRLGLAHRTVRTHLDRLLREHGFHSRTEAAAAWLRGQQG